MADIGEGCYVPKIEKGEVLKSMKGVEREFRAPRLSQWGIPLEGEFSDEELKAELELQVNSGGQEKRESGAANTDAEDVAAEDALISILREAIRGTTVRVAAETLPKRETPHYWTFGGEDIDIQQSDGGNTDLAQASIDAERLRKTLLLPECQHLAEYVLDSTVFNLMQECMLATSTSSKHQRSRIQLLSHRRQRKRKSSQQIKRNVIIIIQL